MFENILLAVDGSDHSSKAAKLAGDLARLSGGKLRVVTVYEKVPSYLGEPNLSQTIAKRTAKAEEILDKATKEIGEIPGDCEPEILSGDPAQTVSVTTANRACGVTPDRDLAPVGRQRIVDQQAPRGRFAAAYQKLQCFDRHYTADDTHDRTEDS